MKKEDFKKNANVTYVYVEGEARGVVVNRGGSGVKEYRSDILKYNGFIEISYRYDDFNSFSPKQQLAICQATMAKAGLCYQLDKCDIDIFFEE